MVPARARGWFELLVKAAYNRSLVGGVAQLGERRVRNAEVVSSILILSTTNLKPGLAPGFFTPAKGQQRWGFADGATFDDRH